MTRRVRPAESGDAELLARLNRPVQQLHARLHPDLFKSAPDEAAVAGFFAGQLAAPSSDIGIYEADGEPLGYIWAERRHRAETPFCAATARLYIHHLSVVESARRQGAATALLDWAIGQARAAGIGAVALDHWAVNEDAAVFFLRRGFTAERMGMSRPL